MVRVQSFGGVLRRSAPWLIVTWFACFSLLIIQAVAAHETAIWSEPGIDVTAAAAWLTGANPWNAPWHGARFAGPPTMLMPYAPLVVIGPEASRWVVGPICVVAALWAIRRLRAPLWWIVWPPLLYAVVHGSFDSLIPALVISGLGPLAAFVKPYVAFVLRPREVLGLVLIVLITAPLLPWPLFISELGRIQASFQTQSLSLSVFGQPLLMVAVALAAWRVGKESRWLVVPALWPMAQFQYGVMALPYVVRHPWLAVGMAVPLPGAAAVTLIAWALVKVLEPSLASLAGEPPSPVPDGQTAAATSGSSDGRTVRAPSS